MPTPEDHYPMIEERPDIMYEFFWESGCAASWPNPKGHDDLMKQLDMVASADNRSLLCD